MRYTATILSGNTCCMQVLGAGAYAIVYLAWDGYLRRYVAIKILRSEVVLLYRKRFLIEARLLAQLNHPHIVHIIEFDRDRGIPYFVMDYMAGGSLRQCHPLGQKLSLSLVIEYVWQVANALLYLHELGIVHGDIKPENLLCGEDGQIYLADFGSAIIITIEEHQDDLRAQGTILYTAPECFRGHCETASDQYSLAVVVYEWLTAEFLFNGTTQEVIQKHTYMPPSLARLIAADVPLEVCAVLLRALAKQPEERFRNVFDFALALNKASIKPWTRR